MEIYYRDYEKGQVFSVALTNTAPVAMFLRHATGHVTHAGFDREGKSSEQEYDVTYVDDLDCELIRAGFVQLALNYQHCNKINVFPVPDGDTGNNMVISTRGAVVAMTKTPPSALSASAMLVAGQTAICSTGNSGTLLSYMFNKISDGFRETAGGDTFDSLTLDQVAVIFNAVGKDMSNAMTNAVPCQHRNGNLLP